MGRMGWWNVILNTLFCLSIIVLSATGIVMWWLRRPKGEFRLAAPQVPGPAPLVKGVAFIALALAVIFPLMGLALIALLAFDLLVISRVPALRRMVG
ncbi:hypothetical protein [Fulvimarina sp. MAC3]|uniref:hypothetical protein n=1 Tax=Fulvimarina sp. MAC3 TaxID=3148887 RepID=UPI0031FDFDD5